MSKRRTSLSVQRQRIDRLLELYLRDCYRLRTVARASELAANLGANRTYLSRTVPAALGMPLRQALHKRQLEYAAHLLRRTRLTVDEIAARAAFGHRSTFYRRFRKAFGESPEAYRLKVTKCD